MSYRVQILSDLAWKFHPQNKIKTIINSRNAEKWFDKEESCMKRNLFHLFFDVLKNMSAP